MTPEEIVNDLQHYGNLSPREVIEAIKKYAREMCDKQKRECEIQWEITPTGGDEATYIRSAPYPKELQ